MSQTYISADLRRQVIQRAGNCCEYCLLSADDSMFSFQVDHIISEKHEGETLFDNLAFSCPSCNSSKGSDIGSYDKITKELIPLYNPRTHKWDDHFQLDGILIQPTSSVGRVTVRLLKLNREEQLSERKGLIRLGRYPCK